ncbi:MAG: AraC family transcriptional regulator [Cellulosilyticaceae bacterium]
MINLSGYIKADDENLECRDKRLSINSVGYYQMKTRNIGLTLRSEGRADYQIIYIAKGKGYFILDGKEKEIEEGNIIFYRPGQMQQYSYSYKDQSEIYWIHFTGYEVEHYLRELKFGENQVYEVGFSKEYTELWNRIIAEIQVKRLCYESIVEGTLLQLLGMMGRNIYEEAQNTTRGYIQQIIEEIHKSNYNPLMIKEYAKQCNMSVCWFINSFKQFTGMTPQQYIIQMKINKAKGLLVDTQLNIGEIADILGFQNAFYFSRVFKKATGVSPKEWRK